jgi:hypothetical protein
MFLHADVHCTSPRGTHHTASYPVARRLHPVPHASKPVFHNHSSQLNSRPLLEFPGSPITGSELDVVAIETELHLVQCEGEDAASLGHS